MEFHKKIKEKKNFECATNICKQEIKIKIIFYFNFRLVFEIFNFKPICFEKIFFIFEK